MGELVDDTRPGPVRFERSFTVDSGFAGRMTAVSFRTVLLTRWRVIRIAAVSLAVPGVITPILSPDPVARVGLFILLLVAVLSFYALAVLIAAIPARKQIGERHPVGSKYSIALTDTSMTLTDPKLTATLSYTLYKSLRIYKDAIALRPRRGSIPAVVPRELFTEESLSWLESTVNNAV